jgi:hypothetical protein
MKLELENARIKSNYQKVSVCNARNVLELRDVLTLKYVDKDTGKKFTIAELIETLFSEIENLKKENEQIRKEISDDRVKANNVEKLNLDIIEELKKETREKGIL